MFNWFKKKTYSLILVNHCDLKVNAIKTVRRHTGMGLKEAKGLVDNPPSAILEGLSKSDAQSIRKEMISEYKGMEIRIDKE